MKAQGSYDRAKELAAEATAAAADMRLVKVEESGLLARYLLRGRRWSWAEVVVLHHGHLLVHGDLDAVIFGGCHGHTRPRHVLEWMAFAGHDYAREKASIGSSSKIARQWDPRVAMARVLDWRRYKHISKEDAQDLLEGLSGGWSQHEFMEAVYSTDGLDSEDCGAGEVTALEVFNAQGVLRRLVECLEQRDLRRRAREWFARPESAATVVQVAS